VGRLTYDEALVFAPVGKLGLGKETLASLGRAVALHRRGIEQEMTQGLAAIDALQLFLLYEFLHALLGKMSDRDKNQRDIDAVCRAEAAQKAKTASRNSAFAGEELMVTLHACFLQHVMNTPHTHTHT
jgi:hypothetical protein